MLVIYGTKNNGEVRATVNALNLTLTPQAYISDATEVALTDNIYDQLVQIISSIGLTDAPLTKQEIRGWVHDDAAAIISEFIRTPEFQGLAIEDGAIERRHLNNELQASIDRADSAL